MRVALVWPGCGSHIRCLSYTAISSVEHCLHNLPLTIKTLCYCREMQPPRLRDQDNRLYRCSHRLGDTEVAPPYELVEVRPGLYNLYEPNVHFSVHHNVITILESDANPGANIPKPRDSQPNKRRNSVTHSRAIPFPAENESRKEWLHTVGALIAVVMFGKKGGASR